MLVLVEDFAQAVAPAYVEAGDLRRIGDRAGEWAQRAGVCDALMGAVGIVSVQKEPWPPRASPALSREAH